MSLESARSIFLTIYDFFVYALFFIMIVDYALVAYLKKHYPDLDNPYFRIYKEHGFTKVNIVKMIAAIFIVNAIWITRAGKEIYFTIPIIYYGYHVFRLLIDVIRAGEKSKQHQE